MRILLFAALWPEVRGLVRMMGMRARQSQLPYRQYQDERGEVLLTLTGPGPVAVAAAVGAVLAVHGPASLVLVGSAAGKMTGQYVGPYRVNRLIDADGRRSFYPDLIYPYAFPLPEAALYSRSRIWTPEEIRTVCDPKEGLDGECSAERGPNRGAGVSLFDMEGAAFFQAANSYLGPQQIHILKMVSDRGQAGGERMTAQLLETRMRSGFSQIEAYLRTLIKETRKEEETADRLAAVLPGQEELVRRAGDLCCSASMKEQLKQLLTYAGLAGKDWRGRLKQMEVKEKLPAADRRQGKLLLRELADWVMRDE